MMGQGDQSGYSEGLMQTYGRNQGYHHIIQLQGSPGILSSKELCSAQLRWLYTTVLGKIKLKNKLEPAYGSLELYSKIVRILSCSQSFYTEKCDVQNVALR